LQSIQNTSASERSALARKFSGTWFLERHGDGYEEWLAIKGVSAVNRKIATSLPAKKQFLVDDVRQEVTLSYTLAHIVHLTQSFHTDELAPWQEEEEGGVRCLIRARWEEEVFVIEKRFPQLGLEERVWNSVSLDGKHLTSKMQTQRIAVCGDGTDAAPFVTTVAESRTTTDTFSKCTPSLAGMFAHHR